MVNTHSFHRVKVNQCIYSQCIECRFYHWFSERVRKWGTEAVKRRAAVKLMQMPWNPNAAQETAPKWSESLSHSLVLASSKWLFNVVTCGRYELMCREQSFPLFISFSNVVALVAMHAWLGFLIGAYGWNELPVLSPFVLTPTPPIYPLIQLVAHPA